jgi:hypothetical protein
MDSDRVLNVPLLWIILGEQTMNYLRARDIYFCWFKAVGQ